MQSQINHYSFLSIKKVAAAILIVSIIQSCSVSQKYQRPQVVDENLYRTDMLKTDTANIADLSWKQLFTDPLLTKYIQQALSDNLDIRVAIKQIEIAHAYLSQAKAQYFPTVSAGPSVAYQTSSLNTQMGKMIGSRQHMVQYGLAADLSWEADIWGKLKSNERANVANYLGTEAAHQAVKSQLVSSIAETYYRLLALDEQKKITEETIASRSKNIETTQALKDAGLLTEVAVKQSEAQLLNAKGILVDIENNIKLTENLFSVLLGTSPQSIERASLSVQQINTSLAVGVPSQLLRNRPDVKAAEYDLINAFELTNVAKANFYPALRLTGSTGLQSVDIDKLFSPGSLFASAAASLLQPVINKRQIRTQHEISLAQQQIAQTNFKKAVLTAGREVSDALYTYDAQTKMVTIKQQEFDAYNKATEYSQELVNYGMANYLEVLRANENALNAQLSFINAKYGQLNAIVDLYRALGGGWR